MERHAKKNNDDGDDDVGDNNKQHTQTLPADEAVKQESTQRADRGRTREIEQERTNIMKEEGRSEA